MTSSLDQVCIRERIPHAGQMCLLDAVETCSAESIVCRAESQHRADHPLRMGGQLRSIAGVEYAAQAMALHGALNEPAEGAAAAGYLVTLREVRCHTAQLDDDPGALTVAAHRIMGDTRQSIYRFSVRSSNRELVSGRAVVILHLPNRGG